MQANSSDTPADVLTMTREELYEHIWEEPVSRLAPRLGISDVALAKTCKRMGIPRPTRGYWAQLDAGQRVKKEVLPPIKLHQPTTVQFRVSENLKRRESAQKDGAFSGSLPEEIQVPGSDVTLNRIAARLAAEISKSKPAEDGRVHVRVAGLPEVVCAPNTAARVAGAVHVIIEHLERNGVVARPGTESNSCLDFVRDPDAIEIRIEEEMEEIERVPTPEEKRRPSWEWQTKIHRPSGHLMFRLGSKQRIAGRKQWTESASRPLEKILPLVIERILEAFQEFVDERVRQEEQRRAAAERERRWEEERAKEHHRGQLQSVAAKRAELLHRAAQWWQIHQADLEFIAACEKYWRNRQEGQLTKPQEEWLAWALKNADAVSPLTAGYPDPEQDGPFDADAVPFGGPYPIARTIPDPPIFRQPNQAVPDQYYQRREAHPYPFWLRNRGR